jgi:RNA polymerase subunit RPABC4/transcription elongation factor Spt4
MDLRTPIHLGGDHYLEAVSVGKDPDDLTVFDCPVCGGYGFADRWHPVATVFDADADTRARARERYRYCGNECLTGFLRTFR